MRFAGKAWSLGTLACCAVLAAGLSGNAQARIIYETDFSDLNEWQLRGNGKQKIVPSPDGGQGGSAVRYELNYGDSTNYRSETVHKSGTVPKEVRNAKMGETYWYGFSIWLDDYAPDKDDEIVFQWHGSPDTDAKGRPIEAYRNPPLALMVSGRHDPNGPVWRVWSFGDPRKITPNRSSYADHRTWNVAPAETGRWYHWVFRVKWGHQTAGKPGAGELTVWLDGEQVIHKVGSNAFNDAKGPYIATGIYKYFWKNQKTDSTRRVRYTGALKIADRNGSFEMVSTMPEHEVVQAQPPAAPTGLNIQIVPIN